jgi:signal transduction histidine kinase
MKFSDRLRVALVLAALLPTVLITLIVITGISEQVDRMQNGDAQVACSRFAELQEYTVKRIRENLNYIANDRDFQLAEWNLHSGKPPDPNYNLPLLSLDFVEYADADETIRLSATRPGMIGRPIEPAVEGLNDSVPAFIYENDTRGSHPSLVIVQPTENGYLRGGVFLDGDFDRLAMAVTRAEILFIDMRAIHEGPGMHTVMTPGVPYLSDESLCAVLALDSTGEFYPLARFLPYHTQSLFANFLTGVAAVTLFSLLLVIPAGLYFSSRTRRALKNLVGGAGRVASGDFSQPVPDIGEEEFGQLAESFNDMMKQLGTYRERLIVSQKIAAWQTIGRRMAHEVKNPLTPITVAVDDLRLSYHEHRPDFERVVDECTATIKRQIGHLRKLLDQFSMFAKMPAPDMRVVTAAEFLQPLTVLFKDDLAAGRVIIDSARPEDIRMRIDPDQMQQVIINLVKNSREAGANVCTLAMTATDDRIEMTVEDDGPGFPPKLLDEGIMPYFSTKERGSGLGLTICQRIVFDHEGTLALDNKTEGGGRVRISLPRYDV